MERYRSRSVGVLLLCTLAAAAPAYAQNLLEAYTGPNATGYLAPLVDAFRSNLNSGLFNTARVEPNGFHVSLELVGMTTFFDDESRTFMASTDQGNNSRYVRVPTIVGDPEAVFTEGYASTIVAFPGGFDVSNWYLSAPQLRIGNWKGTEALVRAIFYNTGNDEIGDLGVWGGGLRHSISQYFPGIAPFDLAVSGMWQHAQLTTSQNLHIVDSNLYTLALHTGMAMGPVYPYAGVAVDWYRFGVHYEVEGFDPVDLQFNADQNFQFTLGASYRVGFVAAYGEYNFADQNTLAAGLSLNFPFSSRSVAQ